MENLEKEKQQMQSYIKEIEHENSSLKNEMIELASKLSVSEKFKSHFISNVTNELMNPVTSLVAFSTLILENIDDKEKITKYATTIKNESTEITFQLKNIFMSAVFESGNYSISYSKLKTKNILEDTLKEFEHLINKKKLKIVVEDCCNENQFIITDADKFRLVLANLLHNAIQYSKNEDKIKIHGEISDNMLSITVTNYGIVLDEEYFDKVFDRFYRVDNTINSVKKGSGLGLSVSKQIVELLGGKIFFKSIDDGTEIYFEIPINQTDDLSGNSIKGSDIFFDDNFELF